MKPVVEQSLREWLTRNGCRVWAIGWRGEVLVVYASGRKRAYSVPEDVASGHTVEFVFTPPPRLATV